jgi:hypothetical protein
LNDEEQGADSRPALLLPSRIDRYHFPFELSTMMVTVAAGVALTLSGVDPSRGHKPSFAV